MIPLIILLAVLAAFGYAYRKRGLSVVMFVAAGIGFLGSSGVFAERLFGPRWSWNLAHHGMVYAVLQLIECLAFMAYGLHLRDSHRQSKP